MIPSLHEIPIPIPCAIVMLLAGRPVDYNYDWRGKNSKCAKKSKRVERLVKMMAMIPSFTQLREHQSVFFWRDEEGEALPLLGAGQRQPRGEAAAGR